MFTWCKEYESQSNLKNKEKQGSVKEGAKSIVDLMAANRQNTIVIGKNEKLRYRETLQKQMKLKKQLEYLKETQLSAGELSSIQNQMKNNLEQEV